jgi:hypothetical protein
MFQSDWPTADGSGGITSSKVMDEVEAASRAVEVGSNFFLFFSSEHGSMSAASHAMHVHLSDGGTQSQGGDSEVASNKPTPLPGEEQQPSTTAQVEMNGMQPQRFIGLAKP